MLIFSELSSNIPFFGVIFALILLLGLYEIGERILNNRLIYNVVIKVSEIKYQKILISVCFILLISFPLVLYFRSIYSIQVLGAGIFIFGLYGLIINLIKIKRIKLINILANKKLLFNDETIVYLSLIGLFILSLAPNTHADSLGYHFTAANNLINGELQLDITHLHTFLAGSGEIMIAIGLLFGSEQFGNLIQFSGLISIVGIFKNINNENKFYYLLLAITTPVILFLGSTAKPQLFHICSIAFVFSLYFLTNSNQFSKKEKIIRNILSLSILLVAFNAKFNFLLNGIILGGYIFYSSYRNQNLRYFVSTVFVLFLFFYLPIILIKYNLFGGNLIQYFYSPVPLNVIGMTEFKTYLTQYGKEANYYKILVPSNLNQFTNSVGISFIYIFFLNYKNSKTKVVFLMIVTYIVVTYYFGQFIGRSFLEPLIMITLMCAKYGTIQKFNFLKYIFKLQSYLVIVLIFFGAYILFPGSLSSKSRDNVLSKHAMGYSLFKWANTKLSNEDTVLSYHRSVTLGKSEYISMDFAPFVNLKSKESYLIVEKIKKKNPKFYLTYGFLNRDPFLSVFKNCLGRLLYFEEKVGHHAARNPYNIGSFYNGYIYQFKIEDFPNCAQTPSEIK